jgi:arylsulfatase A-like enzyme
MIRIFSNPAAFWDFLPTACDLAGISHPEEIDGLSFLPAMMGEGKEQQEHEFLSLRSIRQGKK